VSYISPEYTNDPCGSELARDEAGLCNTKLNASIQSLATAPSADIPLIIANTPHSLSVLLVDAPQKKSEANSVKLPKRIRPMKILRRYKYDPLDRLAGLQAQEQAFTQRFYQENDLVTELGEEDQQTIFRHGEQPLAQRQTLAGATDTLLLATDQAHSVLQTLSPTRREHMAYSAYGHRPADSGLSSLLGFNGECLDGITGHYLLGQGKRAFNPVLMRFNSPDELSPFGEGGINPYAYCGGDPINFQDPTGSIKLRIALSHFKLTSIAKSSKNITKPKTGPLKQTIPTVAQPIAHDPQSEVGVPIAIPKSQLKAKQRPRETPSKSTLDSRNLKNRAKEYDEYISENPGDHPMPPSKYQDKLNRRLGELEEAKNRNAPEKELNVFRVNYLRALRTFKVQAIKAIDLTAKKVRTS
jgi:RHS repeat-associated protein